MADHNSVNKQSKDKDLERATTAAGQELTDNMGHRVADDQNSLRGGTRGPTLMEDFLFREKLHHFDHERIPERVVHARGAGAHGYFELYESLAEYTTASVLTDTSKKTPVFVRFSTVAGSRGSVDTARDVRGFAVKFYTDEGNWDIVGNNIPVFFIQDAIKFPDLIHAVKPEPHNEIPQAASAHDTFYDFISLTPESMHMIMWIMSDRAIPRSYRMMEGFGVHTFRLINAEGKSTFVKFHWKPVLGAHSLVWDEAVKIAGMDADFHRRDLWDAIEMGDYPQWEFGVQLMPEEDEMKYDFDILDATKIWPEDLIPVRRIGKMTLNRNPDNFFAETEQVAFMTTNIVPGIDFTDDPLLQGRNFSYLDTQLSRLGTPNWAELPINRPLANVSNNQRDAHMRYTINKGRVSYYPNGLDGNMPGETGPNAGAYRSYPEQLSGQKVRVRSESFNDHYGQARLFWNSMTPVEKEHIVKAQQFELSKCDTRDVRLRMLSQLEKINDVLAAQVAMALGETVPTSHATGQPNGTADSADEIAALAGATSETSASGGLQRTGGLSLLEGQPQTAKGRKVAILTAKGCNAAQITSVKQALQDAGVVAEVVGPHMGALGGSDGADVEAVRTFANSGSVLYDAVFVPGGAAGVEMLKRMGDARKFVDEAYKHGKPIAFADEGTELLKMTEVGRILQDNRASPDMLLANGIVAGRNDHIKDVAQQFIDAIAKHRFFDRMQVEQVPA